MKKLIATIVLFAGFVISATAQDHRKADYAVKQFQKFYNTKQADSLFNLMSPRIKQLMPLEKVKEMVAQLHERVGVFSGYEYMRQEGKMTYYRSLFSEGASLLLIASLDSLDKLDVFRFVPDKREDSIIPEKGASEVTATNGNVILHGTLTMLEAAGKVPVVLLIAGSGPTDRNGNNNMGMTTYIYRILADSLRNAGIACVRYDKRGIGASQAANINEADARFEDMVGDAEAFIKMLNADSRFSGVSVIGHSEGSLVGMLAAHKESVKKYISLAGVSEPADKVLQVQVAGLGADVAQNAAVVMDSLKKGYDVQHINPKLMSVFRPSIQPYMRSWFKYDPSNEIKKLNIPVMIIQGHKDMQVAEIHAEQLKKAQPSAQLLTFSSMNHVLRDVVNDDENGAAYHNATMPLTAGLTEAIIAFIRK